ncbi:MAG: hypothetical protein JW934_00810 [Anaerolineae bacterium]|nr:hypothetical protein [Anaerolineae bacterium]
MQGIPTVVIPSFVFGSIPVGLALCAMVLIPFWIPNPDVARNFLCGGVGPLLGFGFLLVVWQPRWVLPRWYRWLKDNYGNIMPQLREDAQRIGRWEWAAMVRTQEGLEQWARSVQQRVDAERQPKGPPYHT